MSEESQMCPDCESICGENDEAVLCELCNTWFHKKCQKITKALYTIINSKEGSNISWYCNHCKRGAKSLLEMMQQLNMNHNKLERRVSTLEKNDKLSATKEDLKPLNDRMAKLEKNEGATGGSNTATVIREMEDRSRRTNNLVLFNVPENNDADQLTRNSEDTSMVKNICTKHLSISDPFQILKPTRLGKKPANPNLHRPLRVTIPDIQTKNEIQKKAAKMRDLSDNKLNKIVISQDLTQLQREEIRELRSQQRERNQQLIDDQITDFRWKIRDGRLLKMKVSETQ